jgi:UDPglucose--hexose-1-phosphate uridylyltransferase
VFDNDYPALLPSAPSINEDVNKILRAKTELGICRVICFSPRHDLTIPRMTTAAIRQVIDVWVEQFRLLDSTEGIQYVQIFENRGALMGASNPHPHCQIWASSSVPDIPAAELCSFREHFNASGSCLLCDYLRIELARNERIVFQNDSFAAVVPYWAVWPFEILLLSKRHLSSIDELADDERSHLAASLREITTRYDNLFQTLCPYSMGFHQRPSGGEASSSFHFHGHYYPPLLRSASVQKYMVGYEMLASPQRDLTAETAAQSLVSVPSEHFLHNSLW